MNVQAKIEEMRGHINQNIEVTGEEVMPVVVKVMNHLIEPLAYPHSAIASIGKAMLILEQDFGLDPVDVGLLRKRIRNIVGDMELLAPITWAALIDGKTKKEKSDMHKLDKTILDSVARNLLAVLFSEQDNLVKMFFTLVISVIQIEKSIGSYEASSDMTIDEAQGRELNWLLEHLEKPINATVH